MTTWTFKVGEPYGPIDQSTRIELDRGSITLLDKEGRVRERIWINENNQLDLLFFAQQLISIIAEMDNQYVLKKHTVVSARAINDFRHREAW